MSHTKIVLPAEEIERLMAFLNAHYQGPRAKKSRGIVRSGNTEFKLAEGMQVAGDWLPAGTNCTIFRCPDKARRGESICVFITPGIQITLKSPNKLIRIDLNSYGVRPDPMLLNV